MRRRTAAALIAAAAACLLALAAILPPSGHRLASSPEDRREIGGSLHVHTSRSDGTGTPDEVAAAAARAGLQFVIFTDHGDGTRVPDPPQYRAGVLCLDAVEISTSGGHYIALGLASAAPYRLAGEPRDVIADVARLGGFGVVAHPDSEKPELAWREWLEPFDALEWLNADSEWRDEPPRIVARALAGYWFRPAQAIASLFGRPSVLARWDALTRRRRVIALAGHDAHARVGLRGNWEPAAGDYSLHVPSYEAAFSAFSIRARLAAPVSGDASRDAQLLLGALRAGHVYTVIDAVATPARLTFTAQTDQGIREGGDDVVTRSPVDLQAAVSAVPSVQLVLLRNGRVIATADGPTLAHRHQADGTAPAVYRVEGRLDSVDRAWRAPWIVSNPIRILPAADPRRTTGVAPSEAVKPLPPDRAAFAWLLERDASTHALIAPHGERGVRVDFTIPAGPRLGQYAAAGLTVQQGTFTGWDRIRFAARASHEMRVSVQVREPQGGQRWIRSVVVFPASREIVVRLTDMRPVEPATGAKVPREQLASLLFVVDTTHTVPGASGTIFVEDVRLERDSGGTTSGR